MIEAGIILLGLLWWRKQKSTLNQRSPESQRERFIDSQMAEAADRMGRYRSPEQVEWWLAENGLRLREIIGATFDHSQQGKVR